MKKLDWCTAKTKTQSGELICRFDACVQELVNMCLGLQKNECVFTAFDVTTLTRCSWIHPENLQCHIFSNAAKLRCPTKQRL